MTFTKHNSCRHMRELVKFLHESSLSLEFEITRDSSDPILRCNSCKKAYYIGTDTWPLDDSEQQPRASTAAARRAER